LERPFVAGAESRALMVGNVAAMPILGGLRVAELLILAETLL